MDKIRWKRSGAVSKVLNKSTSQKFVISTALNPYGIWETAVFEANEMFLPHDLEKPLVVLNASDRSQAEEQHLQTAITFRTKEPSSLIRHYERRGTLSLGQQLYSESEKQVASDQPHAKPLKGPIPKLNKGASKHGFWSKVQMISLSLFVALVIVCFVWNWWLVIPALVFFALNGVAYANRMKSLGRDPSTRDIRKVV